VAHAGGRRQPERSIWLVSSCQNAAGRLRIVIRRASTWSSSSEGRILRMEAHITEAPAVMAGNTSSARNRPRVRTGAGDRSHPRRSGAESDAMTAQSACVTTTPFGIPVDPDVYEVGGLLRIRRRGGISGSECRTTFVPQQIWARRIRGNRSRRPASVTIAAAGRHPELPRAAPRAIED